MNTPFNTPVTSPKKQNPRPFTYQKNNRVAWDVVISDNKLYATDESMISPDLLGETLSEKWLACDKGHFYKCKDCYLCLIMSRPKMANCEPLCKSFDSSSFTPRNSTNINSIVFKCSKGHTFVTDAVISLQVGCRFCELTTRALKKYDNKIIIEPTGHIEHEDSRVRARCLAIAPANAGGTPSKNTKVYNAADKVCNREFYITERLLAKSHTDCGNCHYCTVLPDRSTMSIIRILEVYFGVRFDDNLGCLNAELNEESGYLLTTYSLSFTAYNDKLKLAVTFMGDRVASKCVSQAMQWCEHYNIIHILIPDIYQETREMLDFLCPILTGHKLQPVGLTVQTNVFKFVNRKLKALTESTSMMRGF